MADDTYDASREARLLEMLRALAQRIIVLDAEGRLLRETPGLLRAMGDVRAELFRYEVRQTFDAPEIAEHRRIVSEAAPGWSPDHGGPIEEDGWPEPDAP